MTNVEDVKMILNSGLGNGLRAMGHIVIGVDEEERDGVAGVLEDFSRAVVKTAQNASPEVVGGFTPISKAAILEATKYVGSLDIGLALQVLRHMEWVGSNPSMKTYLDAGTLPRIAELRVRLETKSRSAMN